jgi:soluble lytic murein transglycosylase-like protein
MKTFFIKTMLTTILLLCITFSVVNNKIYFEVNVDNISDSIYKDIKEQYFKNINIKLNKKHLYLMEEARINYDIPMHIFYNVMYYESSFNSNAISKTGARGYMQLTGICIKHYNIVNDTKLTKKTLTVKDNLTIGA